MIVHAHRHLHRVKSGRDRGERSACAAHPYARPGPPVNAQPIYHLKEADPHAWVIPRLSGQAKASVVAVEFDEFGGGRADRADAQLYADLLEAAGLHPGYPHYLDQVPAPAIAAVNVISLLGLHRALLRGALVGHFTAAEITTAPGAYRIFQVLHRLQRLKCQGLAMVVCPRVRVRFG